MSGIKKEKRIDQKTEKDLEEEELQVKFILAQISDIKTGVEEIRSLLGERKHEKVKTDKANSNEVKSYLISRKKLNK